MHVATGRCKRFLTNSKLATYMYNTRCFEVLNHKVSREGITIKIRMGTSVVSLKYRSL